MLTLDHYARIRLAHRDGMSIREIAKQFHHSRQKIREVLQESEPTPYTRRQPPTLTRLGPFVAIIDAMLQADEQAPRKQRHTAKQIFRRLVREHGYPGSYPPVQRYVRKKKQRERETFLPLAFDPGQRAEADFGEIAVDFPEGRRKVSVLIVTWAHSYAPFAIALPSQRTEAILHGMAEAFTFFGCVPRELWWDNPTTVATEILTGRERRLNDRYAALASHYIFEPLFCMPRRGNEKPHVENRVKDLERRWATPVPQCRDLAELNGLLQKRCVEDRERCATGQTETIGQRFAQEMDKALPLPKFPFDACVHRPGNVDKYQTVAFDGNRYSVPRRFAFQEVMVKGYVHEVVIVAQGQEVARHVRSYQTQQQVMDPLHYLSTLKTKPAYLDHAEPFRSWVLPGIFEELRVALEKQHGAMRGSRQYSRVLMLMEQHPLERVQQAIESSRQGAGFCVEMILQRVSRQAACSSVESPSDSGMSLKEENSPEKEGRVAPWGWVQVPRPDLRSFDQLLPKEEA